MKIVFAVLVFFALEASSAQAFQTRWSENLSFGERGVLLVHEQEIMIERAVSTCRFVRGVEDEGALAAWRERNLDALAAARPHYDRDGFDFEDEKAFRNRNGRFVSQRLSRDEDSCRTFLDELAGGVYDLWERIDTDLLMALLSGLPEPAATQRQAQADTLSGQTCEGPLCARASGR